MRPESDRKADDTHRQGTSFRNDSFIEAYANVSNLWEQEWRAIVAPHQLGGFPASTFSGAGVSGVGAAPAWAKTPEFQGKFAALLGRLNDHMVGTFLANYGGRNENGKREVRMFNNDVLAKVNPPHKLVFYNVARERKLESSKHSMGRTYRDDEHRLYIAPEARFRQPDFKFLERTANYNRWCCCGKGMVDTGDGRKALDCKFKYTTTDTKCDTGMWIFRKHHKLKDVTQCLDYVVNPDTNDAPPPPRLAAEVPRSCNPGEYYYGCSPQQAPSCPPSCMCTPQNFCNGPEVQRDCGVPCPGCAVVINC